MESFPRYRIPVAIGWLLPPILSFFLARELPYHLLIKILLFVVLAAVFYIVEMLVAIKITQIWNRWQKEK